MPTYVMVSALTPEGVQTVKEGPARIREANNPSLPAIGIEGFIAAL